MVTYRGYQFETTKKLALPLAERIAQAIEYFEEYTGDRARAVLISAQEADAAHGASVPVTTSAWLSPGCIYVTSEAEEAEVA